jgi:hypothetical protein
MLFPRAAIASPAEFPAGAFDGATAAAGSPFADAGEDEPADGGVPGVAVDAPPRLLT